MFVSREEALVSSVDDMKKLQLLAEANKLTAESLLIEENYRNIKRNNAEYDANARHAREYTFYDPIKPQSVSKCMEELGQWSRRDPQQPIRIVLNSPGGAVLDGLALFDYLLRLRALGHHIEVVALGLAASMGGVLLQAGNIRTMGANSWLMIHEVNSGSIGSTSELEDELEFTKRLQDNLVEILAERSSLTTKNIKLKWKKKDWWLSSKQALEFGFIDNIQA